jgi:hypothetical protein
MKHALYLLREGYTSLPAEVHLPCVSGECIENALMQQLHNIFSVFLSYFLITPHR